MSIHIVDLTQVSPDVSKAIEERLEAFYVTGGEGVKGNPSPVVLTVIEKINEGLRGQRPIVSEDISFLTDDLSMTLGRIGLREITSPWAQRQYPGALHELVITLIDAHHDQVHVLLVYL